MLSRRALIGKAAVGAAAAVAVGAARTGLASTRVLRAATKDPTDDRDGLVATQDGQHVGGPHADGQTADAQSAATPPADAAASAPPPPPPWALLTPLAAGALVTHGWRLRDLGPVQNGSCVVTLENARGRAHRVHVCRNDGAPQGLVYTRRLDLVVMNEGHGDLPTEEGLAQAVARLAHVVAGNEVRARDRLADLLPHAERVRRFAADDGTPAMAGKLR